MGPEDDRAREVRACLAEHKAASSAQIAQMLQLDEAEVCELLHSIPEAQLKRILHGTEEWVWVPEPTSERNLDAASVTQFLKGLSP